MCLQMVKISEKIIKKMKLITKIVLCFEKNDNII